MTPNIIPECYADTMLVEMLGFKKPNHQLGIGQVIKTLTIKYETRKAVGIIDDDKFKPSKFQEYEFITEVKGIKRYQNSTGRHLLIVLGPAFEQWVFNNAKEVGVDPDRFGFDHLDRFKKECKRQDVRNNDSVRQFINAIKQKESSGFLQLKTWICEGAGLDIDDFT